MGVSRIFAERGGWEGGTCEVMCEQEKREEKSGSAPWWLQGSLLVGMETGMVPEGVERIEKRGVVGQERVRKGEVVSGGARRIEM